MLKLNEFQQANNKVFNINVFMYIYGKHSDKCIFHSLRFGCSFAVANTIKPELL